MILGFVSHAAAKFSLLILQKIKTLSPISVTETNLKTLMTRTTLCY